MNEPSYRMRRWYTGMSSRGSNLDADIKVTFLRSPNRRVCSAMLDVIIAFGQTLSTGSGLAVCEPPPPSSMSIANAFSP